MGSSEGLGRVEEALLLSRKDLLGSKGALTLPLDHLCPELTKDHVLFPTLFEVILKQVLFRYQGKGATGKTTGSSLVLVRTETGVEQGDSGCMSYLSAAVTKCHDQGSLPMKVLIGAQGSGGRDKSSPSWWRSMAMGTGS